MNALREDAVKAMRLQISNLAGIRQCSSLDASRAVAESMAEALRTARGTRDEPYWRLMLDVAEAEVAAELSIMDRPVDRNPGAAT